MIIRSKFQGWCLTALATAGVFAAGCGDDGNKAKDDAGVPKDSGTDAFVPLKASISIAPLTSDFATVTVGQTSSPTTFTVTNAGPGVSDQVQVNLSGNADYHIASNTCATLAVGATCTIGVTYAPSAVGATTATLQASVTGSTATSMLSGTGGSPTGLTVSPSTFSFANAIIGTPGTDSDTITVTNHGSATTGALTVQAIGSDPSQFTKSADTCNGQTVAANGTCTITVKFAPTTAGQKSAGFTIIGTPGGSVSASVTGLAATAAQLAITPTSQNFGSVVQGTTSSTVAINVANIGGSASGALTAGITGTDAADFAIVTNTCTTVLASANTCQLTLRYTPGKIGAESATLTVAGTPGGSVITALSGTGITPGGLKLDPTTFGFGAIQVNTVSTATTFTVTNTGGTAIGPVVVNFSGSDASEFRDVGGADTCSATTLQPAGKCTFQIAFAPASTGNKSASVIVSAGGNSVTSALTGAGTPPPQLAITPNSQNFGSVGVGTTAAALSFTVTNVGGAATSVPTITLGGANANQFSQTNNCTAALAPVTGSCTVAVTFKPTAIASDVATITATAVTGGTVSASVFGQGTNPAQLSVLPGNLAFDALIGDTTSQTFTVQNNGSTATGTVSVVIGGGLAAADYSQTNTCTTIAAGGTCTVTVTYAPSGTSANATATVSATPGGTATVALAGTAAPRLELISVNGNPPTNPINLGDVFEGSASFLQLAVRNNTNQSQTLNTTFATNSDPSYGFFNLSCGGTIGAHSTCVVFIQFFSQTDGVKKAEADFSIGAGPANKLAVNLVANSIPAITLTPEATNDFGNVTINTTSPTLLIRVTNNAQFTGTTQPIANAINAPFNVTQGSCTGGLSPAFFGTGTTCDLFVTFHPTTLGPFQTTLTVVAASGGSAQIDLHGTGVDASNLQMAPTTLDFGTVQSGDHVDKTIVITNPAGSQTSGPFTITPSGSSEFTLLNDGSAGDCANGATLANGVTCNLRVRFAPVDDNGTSARSGQLNVFASPGAAGSGITASLTGTAKSRISITPTTFAFASTAAGSSATKDFTVHNDSTATVTFASTTFVGGTATDLSTSGTCTGTLAANASCTVTVKFAPQVVDNDSTALTVALTLGQGHAVAAITATSTDVSLYDQTDNYGHNGLNMDSQRGQISADDFVVPSGGWVVDAIEPAIFTTSQSGLTYAVTIYNNNGGLPGTVVASYSVVSTQVSHINNDFGLSLDLLRLAVGPIALTPGHYWISLQTQNSSGSSFWGSRGSTANSPAVTNVCTQPWGTAVACGGSAVFSDTLFQIRGFVPSGPVAHVTPQLVYPSGAAPVIAPSHAELGVRALSR